MVGDDERVGERRLELGPDLAELGLVGPGDVLRRHAVLVAVEAVVDVDLGRKRVIQRRFNVGVPRARSRKDSHASRPFREMITRPKISRNEWKTTEI